MGYSPYLCGIFPYAENALSARTNLQPTTCESQSLILRLYWLFSGLYGKLIAKRSEGYTKKLGVECIYFREKSKFLTVYEVGLLLGL